MNNKKTFLTASIAFAALIIIRSLYYVGAQKSALNIIMVSIVASFIFAMYVIKFLSKDKSVAILPEGKNVAVGSLAVLSAIALVIDGIYRFLTISNLEKVYNDLIESSSQTAMFTILVIRSLLGFGFAIVLILFAVYYFTGNKKMSENNMLIVLPVLWGCARLLEFAFIDGYWTTSALKGVEIIGVIFLVLSLFSIAKMHSAMYDFEAFITFTTQAWLCVPIVLMSSTFGLVDALSSFEKYNVFSYISEFCLALFVFFILKSTKSEELSEDAKNSSSVAKLVFDILDIAVSSLTCVCILLAIFFRTSSVQGESMLDTLHDQDKLFIYSFMYTPKNNDIVVINPLDSLVKARGEAEGKEKIIKRVIAVEGQTLHIDFDTQQVYVDGKKLEEPYRYTPMQKPTKHTIESNLYGNIPEKIPKGYVFVMGDNRWYSSDSRYGEIGLIPVEKVLGKAVFRYFPLNRIKKF